MCGFVFLPGFCDVIVYVLFLVCNHVAEEERACFFSICKMFCTPRTLVNIARNEQSSHTPGGSHQRLYHFQRKVKIVKDFIILNQVVSEKT